MPPQNPEKFKERCPLGLAALSNIEYESAQASLDTTTMRT